MRVMMVVVVVMMVMMVMGTTMVVDLIRIRHDDDEGPPFQTVVI